VLWFRGVSHLQRLFLRTIGVRPGKYIIQQRLNAACRLLEETDDGVYDIALATGFCDQSHFTKMFKRERGITPSEYHRKHRTEHGLADGYTHTPSPPLSAKPSAADHRPSAFRSDGVIVPSLTCLSR